MAAAKKQAVVKAAPPAPPATQSVHPGAMIQALMAVPDVDTDKLMKLFELQEKYDEKVARESYYAAMAKFRGEVPQIKYDSWVNYANKGGGRTDFAFASLAGILGQVQDAMKDCGLTVSWTTGVGEANAVVVTCIITHELGHSESTSLSAQPDQSGGKNSIQAVKSTVSYLRRITLEAMLGLAAKHDDDDGNLGDETKLVTAEDVKALQKMIADTKSDMAKFLVAFAIESLDQLPMDKLATATAMLQAKAKGGAK